MKKRKEIFFLISILFFAFLIRAIWLDKNPIELSGDELDVGYQAFSLLKTGKDYLGNKLPIYLHSFSESRTPLLSYLLIPFVGILGLNAWAVRLPVAIFGVIDILFLYLLILLITKNNRLSLICAFVYSVVPWHLHYSRLAFDTTLLLGLITLGTYFFYKEKWFFSSVCFAFSLYAYNTANVFLPLFIFGLILFNRQKFSKVGKQHFAAAGTFLFLVFPLCLTIFFGQGATRFKSINILNNPAMIASLIFKRTTGISSRVERIFYNKPLAVSKEFFKNYVKSFSLDFLFLNGDPNPRHNLPGRGEFYLTMLPFLLLGVWALLINKEKSLKSLIFLWLFLAPIPSALTVEGGNHATRLSLMIPPLVFLISYGAHAFLKSKKTIVVFFSILIISLSFWLYEYFVHYGKEEYKHWEYGYREIFTWLKQREKDYPRVILNNSHDPILLRYLFWTAKDPRFLQKNYKGDKSEKNILPYFDGFKLENVYLGNINIDDKDWWLGDYLDKETVYLAFQKDEIPGGWDWEKDPPDRIKVLKTIRDPLSKEPYIYLLTAGNK